MSGDYVQVGKNLDFQNLQNFVDEYLMKTEPNNYIDLAVKNIKVTKDSSNNKIIIEEQPKRPREEETPITKKLNTELNLNSFKISISDFEGNTEDLVFGNYKDEALEVICTDLNKIIVDDTNQNSFTHINIITDYLINYNNTGTEFTIFPLKLGESYIDDTDTEDIKINKIKVINHIITILRFFVKKHTEYNKLTPTDLKNKLFIYKLTTNYQTSYIPGKISGGTDKKQVGMQTEGAHMDSCELGNDNYVDDEYCELSSILYINVKNNKSPNPNYYASAAFFYGPEIPMPVRADYMDEMGIRDTVTYKHTYLQSFQEEYKRLFVSAPMTSTGWAIWKNKPKRNIKNMTGNRFGLKRDYGFNIKPVPTINKYTYFSKDGEEFIYHASPFRAYSNKENKRFQTRDICNWAPSGDMCRDLDLQRLNFTVRRSNFNLFRFFRDLFDYSNEKKIYIIALSVIKNLKSLLGMYSDEKKDLFQTKYFQNQNIFTEDNKNTLNNIEKNIEILLDIRSKYVSCEIGSNRIQTASNYFYNIFKNGNVLFYNYKEFAPHHDVDFKPKSNYEDSISLLDDYITKLIDILNPSKIEHFIDWYGPNKQRVEKSVSEEPYRQLEYAQKYLKLKNLI